MKRTPLSKNDIVTLEISDLTPDGAGVGKQEGYVVFVPKTAVGDVVSARILKPLASYAYGKCEAVLIPSKDRCEPRCPVFSKCGGCLFRHIRYEAELRIKKGWVEENFKRIGKLPVLCSKILPSPQADGYRNKAQIPCGTGADGRPSFGFFAPHSHRIIPCGDCSLAPAFYSAVIRCVSEWMEQYGICPYDEETGRGTVRHLFIRDGRTSGEVMVCIVANADVLPHTDVLTDSLRREIPNVVSILLNVNKKPGNRILGDRCVTLWGKDAITDVLCGLAFDISPLSFYQINHDATELLYRTAADMAALSGEETLLDLYCGVGTIGLSMASRAKRLVGVEIIPEAVENARRNARRNGIANAEFICADAGEAAKRLVQSGQMPDVVMLDPPRRGCTPEVLDAVLRMAPSKIVMISCNSATAARDCAYLAARGYPVSRLCAVDLFPRTGHVETVVLLSKRCANDHIEIDLKTDELDLTNAEKKATYQEIINYVFEHRNLNVSTLSIAQVKQKCGITERENYNKPKTKNTKQPNCAPNKDEAIKEALKHFGMI